MGKNTNFIEIGKTRQTLLSPQWMDGWNANVQSETMANIPTTLDGTLHWQNIDEVLRPEIDMSFNFRNAQQYADASQILVLGAFVCKVFLPEINAWFIGKFKLTNSSRQLFLRIAGNNYAGVVGYSFRASSVFTYDSWDDLFNKREIDSRF